MKAKLLPITLKCASLSAVSNPGASAETSQRYRPLVDASTFVSTTLVEVDESVFWGENKTKQIFRRSFFFVSF